MSGPLPVQLTSTIHVQQRSLANRPPTPVLRLRRFLAQRPRFSRKISREVRHQEL